MSANCKPYMHDLRANCMLVNEFEMVGPRTITSYKNSVILFIKPAPLLWKLICLWKEYRTIAVATIAIETVDVLSEL